MFPPIRSKVVAEVVDNPRAAGLDLNSLIVEEDVAHVPDVPDLMRTVKFD
jgi:hypothetical protein